MKLMKMSLAAAMLISVNSYAMENMKFGGDAKLFYGTVDSGDTDLFHKDGAAGNAAASVDAEYNNKEKAVSVTAGITYLTTMGLENTLVSGTFAGNTVEDQVWIDELKLTISPVEKTTVIAGRQYIDTPLAFSETWNIVSNSMDAVVIADTHIPDTTLVGAWIGRGNGTAGFQVVDNNSADMNLGGNYNSYGSAIVNAAGLNIASKGAYSVGAVTKLVPLTYTAGLVL